MNEDATWILKTDRPDMVEGWFRGREVQLNSVRDRVRTLAYGGLEGNTTHQEVYEQIARSLKQAIFIYVLATKAFDERCPTWTSPENKSLAARAEQRLKSMKQYLREIQELSEMVRALCEKTDGCKDASALI